MVDPPRAIDDQAVVYANIGRREFAIGDIAGDRGGVEDTFLVISEPSLPSSTTTVRVPWISTPTRYRMSAGITRLSPGKRLLVGCHVRPPVPVFPRLSSTGSPSWLA